ncbi:MAG TPA: M20/M25/M40 family metallo-hydrolase [Pyrinomonadaceae bacterium]|nr:M20/M25/M40 family metallo-hydrolase [Pyrinomonadaceae bacterium]
MRRKFFYVPSMIALAFAVAFAQQPSSNQPSVDRIRQVIEYLASDALEGRRTGTPGANDAAHYIAGEFNRYGLRPGMQMARPARTRGENQARYLQPFPYVAGVELGKNNLFFVNRGRPDDAMQFLVGNDWMPVGFSSNGQVEAAQLVFAGYGITDAELKYDDYPSAVKGRIALAFSGTPDGDNPHGKFARYEDVRWKAIAARNAGAKALLVITQESNLQDDRLSRLRYDNSAGDSGIPVTVISRQLAIRLFRESDGEKLEALETAFRLVISQHLAHGTASFGFSALQDANLIPVANCTLTLSIDIVRREAPSFNVVGILPGSDPRLKDEAIVLGAHYDHLGRGGEGSLAPREGEIHHGADDNASGVAGLIELARMLSTQNQKPRRTIVFIAFSGEEEGLIGSSYYVNHPVVPLQNTVAMINMDMIGRLKERKLIVGGIGTAQEWRSMVDADNSVQGMTVSLNAPRREAVATGKGPIVLGANGQPVVTMDPTKQFFLTLNEDGYGPSDHSSFYAKQIPVLFLWTGNHDDYHKPSDTADKINYEGEARIVSFVERIVWDIDKSDKRLAYTVAKSDSQGRTMGFRVYLGTIPNYADSNDGLKLDGVRDDSPASKAGLKADDKIVKMAGRDVKNVYDYTYALGEMKAGQEYEVEIVRGSERLTLKITPAARK